jgi:hypothetical protein
MLYSGVAAIRKTFALSLQKPLGTQEGRKEKRVKQGRKTERKEVMKESD